jgi:hypothetical protein
MYKVLTIAREFGSGGAHIAGILAERLNWELIDNALVLEVARAAKVDPKLVQRYDEHVDSWVHRVARRALWHGAIEAVASVSGDEFVDADRIAALAAGLIREAYEKGNCVIVGRGSQCVLQDRPDAFHVYIYAPYAQKVARLRKRHPDANVAQLIESTERTREQFVQQYFGCNRADPHLYHLLISSALGEETAASTILEAMGRPARNE